MISDTAKPNRFSDKSKWEEWSPSFTNFLRSIPGCNGIPLSYVVCSDLLPDLTPNTDFMDDYVAMAVLTGASFEVDSAEVHMYLVKLAARGRNGRGGRGGNNSQENIKNPQSYPATLNNGKIVDIHSLYFIGPEVWSQMNLTKRSRLTQECSQYKIQQAQSTITTLNVQSTIATLNAQMHPENSYDSMTPN